MEEGIDHVTTLKSNLGTILVVEDDPRMQKMLRKIFVDEHYVVVVTKGLSTK